MQVKLQNNWYSPANRLERIEENPHTWSDAWFDFLPPSALILNEGTGEWETLDDSYIGGPARTKRKAESKTGLPVEGKIDKEALDKAQTGDAERLAKEDAHRKEEAEKLREKEEADKKAAEKNFLGGPAKK